MSPLLVYQPPTAQLWCTEPTELHAQKWCHVLSCNMLSVQHTSFWKAAVWFQKKQPVWFHLEILTILTISLCTNSGHAIFHVFSHPHPFPPNVSWDTAATVSLAFSSSRTITFRLGGHVKMATFHQLCPGVHPKKSIPKKGQNKQLNDSSTFVHVKFPEANATWRVGSPSGSKRDINACRKSFFSCRAWAKWHSKSSWLFEGEKKYRKMEGNESLRYDLWFMHVYVGIMQIHEPSFSEHKPEMQRAKVLRKPTSKPANPTEHILCRFWFRIRTGHRSLLSSKVRRCNV